MKRSWKEKLNKKGLRLIEVSAKLRRVKPPAGLNSSEITRWLKEQRAVWSDYPELEEKRKAKLNPKFVSLYLRAHPEIELNEQELEQLFEREEFPKLRAEELELTQRIALALEADPNKRIEAYETLASGIVWLRQMFSGGLKKQLGTKIPERTEFLLAIAQNLEWLGGVIRGNLTEPPGRVNVELANLVDAILKHQIEPLTQVELYQALKAAGTVLPEDPEAFRLWLHRARKEGLVKLFRSVRKKFPDHDDQ
jgi:hypothetical protein